MKTNPIALAALALALFSMNTEAQDKPQDRFMRPQIFTRPVRAETMDYLLFLPQGYDAKADKKWPLILFLHGAGERGTNVLRASIHGPAKYIVQNPGFPFILVNPLCPAGQTWNNAALLDLLDDILQNHAVDARRIYLTGLSMGGYGTWSLGLTRPERFAAIAPICGGGNRIDALLNAKNYHGAERTAALQSLPVWAFHGAKDTVVPLEESERMIKMLQEAQVKELKLTVYPEANHDSWTETYNNPELYEWFLKYKRPAPKQAGKTDGEKTTKE